MMLRLLSLRVFFYSASIILVSTNSISSSVFFLIEFTVVCPFLVAAFASKSSLAPYFWMYWLMTYAAKLAIVSIFAS